MMKRICLVAALAATACGGAEKEPAEPQKSTETPAVSETSSTPTAESPATPTPQAAPAPSYTHGKFVWFEHWTADAKQAEKTKAFYSDLFGWTFAEQEVGGNKFTAIMLGDKPIGLLMSSDKVGKKKALWMGYISTADVDQATNAAKTAGGTVLVEPTDMEGVGRYSVVSDKAGAIYGLVKTKNGDAKPSEPAVGEFGWMELWTSAKGKEQAEAFYTAAVGYEVQPFQSGKNTYSMLAFDKQPYGGIDKAPQAKYAGLWVPYVPVENVDDIVKKAKAAKGKALGKPIDIPEVGRIAHLVDPSGAVIGVMTPEKPKTEATP
jgi:predicted enzyme related to lactoylglutathione lyase